MGDFVRDFEQSSSTIGHRRNPLNGMPFSRNYYKLLEKRRKLPIFAHKDEFMELLKEEQCIIVTGETGSGKTTQIPPWCLEYVMSCWDSKEKKTVVCTQPRRMAALNVALRVAAEMDIKVGEEVGYRYRFEDCTSSETVLKYTTDGSLLREGMTDTALAKYHVIIIDEAHERTLMADVLMGVLKEALRVRPDLKLVIMSATIDVDKFLNFFQNAKLMSFSGRMHPVEIVFSPVSVTNYVEAAVQTVVRIHTQEKIPGDILVFLTGQEEIENACRMIELAVEKLASNTLTGDEVGEIYCIPLYSMLTPEEQELIYEPAPPTKANGAIGRKIVVSTNIAETSLTVDGVVFVVDCGLVKQRIYNPKTRIESLVPAKISKASAQQRAGRAGRTRPGKCYRLYSEVVFQKMAENDTPEILRSELGGIVLQLKRYGVVNLDSFDFMESPDPATIKRAEELLKSLKAVDENGKLTMVGIMMSDFPLEPQISKMIITSCLKYKCLQDILTIAAILSVRKTILRSSNKIKEAAKRAHQEFTHPNSDHITLLNVYKKFKENDENSDWCRRHYLNHQTLVNVGQVRKELYDLVKKADLEQKGTSELDPSEHNKNIKKAIASGFFMQVARHQSAHKYMTTKDHLQVYIHPSSTINHYLHPTWLVYDELVSTSKNYIRTVTAVDPEWVLEIVPDFL